MISSCKKTWAHSGVAFRCYCYDYFVKTVAMRSLPCVLVRLHQTYFLEYVLSDSLRGPAHLRCQFCSALNYLALLFQFFESDSDPDMDLDENNRSEDDTQSRESNVRRERQRSHAHALMEYALFSDRTQPARRLRLDREVLPPRAPTLTSVDPWCGAICIRTPGMVRVVWVDEERTA